MPASAFLLSCTTAPHGTLHNMEQPGTSIPSRPPLSDVPPEQAATDCRHDDHLQQAPGGTPGAATAWPGNDNSLELQQTVRQVTGKERKE